MIRSFRYYAAMTAMIGLVSTGLVLAAWPFSSSGQGKPTLAPLLSKATPAVVSISVVTNGGPNPQRSPVPLDPSLRRFFEVPEQGPQRGVGSGVIVDADHGLILSNHHVVAAADEIVVVLADQRRFDATLVGSDPGTDIAVLKIEADELSALPFGDSEILQVGDFVVAVGNPFGLGQTATVGIVSALGRTGIAEPGNADAYEDFIQTDASINPGNSGGALIDLDGALMGINTAIVSPAGGNVGIGFAVPVNMAHEVMDQIVEYGAVRRGRLGITIQDVTPPLAEALALDVSSGAIISEVIEDSAAAAAGLQSGDVIVEVDGEPIATSAQLRNAIGLVRPGARVALTVVRDGERHAIEANVGAVPERPAEETTARQTPQGAAMIAGAQIQALPEDHPAHGKTRGVLVTRVQPGSNAELAGLAAGDIVTAVNREHVASVAALMDALARSQANAVALTVARSGRQLFVVLHP
jgi:serine protease DegQ